MSLISRVDLLTLLQQTPPDLQVDVANLLGFERIEQAEHYTLTLSSDDSRSTEAPEPTTYMPPAYTPSFWYLQSYQNRQLENQAEITAKPVKHRIRQLQPKSQPLFSAAQQQVLWDRCLKPRLSALGIDQLAAVNILSQAKPLARLPPKKQQPSNQETLLFLDRSQHLTPIGQDQLDLAASLQALLGKEQCQVILMLDGINGPLRRLWRSREPDWTFEQLPDIARLVFISDLGRYCGVRGARQAWHDHLSRLQTLGHPLTVLTPVAQPDQGVAFEQYTLDNKACRFNALKVMICGCLQASHARIRQLRQQVTDGCLEDELRLWNHPQRLQATGLDWQLQPQFLYLWVQATQLSDEQLSRYRQLQADWRASLPMETEGLEQLIDETLDPQHQTADARLLEQVLDAFQRNPGQRTMVFRLLISQQNLLAALAQHAVAQPKWRRLYQAAQAARQLAGSGFATTEFNTVKQSLQLQQIGNRLNCDSRQAARTVLSSKDFLFDLNQNVYVTEQSSLSAEVLRLRTAEAEVQLTNISQPDWAQRFWQEKNAIYAAHADQALFELQPASEQHTTAQWHCVHNPWDWASETGIDDHGLWADLNVDDVTYRLRWIPPGSFVMGSPVTEQNRENNETQHQVILTQGFWLGETSCTQALWQAVMGKNPSRHQANVKLPVGQVSWEDCQQFITQLKDKYPDFTVGLPTEAQWEYACRAGTTTAYWWGASLIGAMPIMDLKRNRNCRILSMPLDLRA